MGVLFCMSYFIHAHGDAHVCSQEVSDAMHTAAYPEESIRKP